MEEKIYKRMYKHLSYGVTTALEKFRDEPEKAFLLLEAAQLDCRNMYMDAPRTRWDQIKRLFGWDYQPKM